jgi:hypothetical protein
VLASLEALRGPSTQVSASGIRLFWGARAMTGDIRVSLRKSLHRATTDAIHHPPPPTITISLQLTIFFRTQFDAFSDTHFGRLDALGSCVLDAQRQNAPGKATADFGKRGFQSSRALLT